MNVRFRFAALCAALLFLAAVRLVPGGPPAFANPLGDAPDRDSLSRRVDAFYREWLKQDPVFRDHDRRYNAAWKKFIAVIDPDSQALARKRQRERLDWRQEKLEWAVGGSVDFRNTVMQIDEPVCRLMEYIAESMSKPDVRLVMALEAVLSTDFDRYRHDGFSPRRNGTEMELDDLLRWKEDDGSLVYTADTMRAEMAVRALGGFAQWSFQLDRGRDGALWGVTRHAWSSRWGDFTDCTLIRIINGRISLLILDPPEPAAFFRTGGKALLDKPPWEGGAGECAMRSVVSIQGRPPYTIRAEYLSTGSGFPTGEVDLCVPECSIVYAWDGQRHAPSRWECLPEGKWGVFPNSRAHVE